MSNKRTRGEISQVHQTDEVEFVAEVEEDEDEPLGKMLRNISNDSDDESGSQLSQGESSQIQHEIDSEKEAEIGIIEEISLINFMSHQNTHLKLGPKQNFITGPNGAGKSSILIGLMTALGARTGFTGRGSKLGDMVRNAPDAHAAIITVKLRNRGDDAFMPEIYGRSIIVVKKIPKDGATSLKIKNEAGQPTQHMTSARLNEILEHFNIQINNPCAILLQETSKEFLAKSTPKQKYDFWLKATQLSDIRNNLQKIQENLTKAEEQLSRKKQLLPQMKDHLDRCREAYESLNLVVQLEEQRRALRHRAAWAAYAEKQRKHAALLEKKQKVDHGKAQKEGELAELQTEREQLVEVFNGFESQLGEILGQLEAHAKEKRQFDSHVRELSLQLQGHQNRVATIAEGRKRLLLRAERLRSAIEKEHQDQSQSYIQEIQNIEQQMAQLEQQRAEMNQLLRPKSEALQQHRALVDGAEQEKRDVVHQLRNAQRTRDEAVRALSAFQQDHSNQISAFSNMRFLDTVRHRAGEFQRPPIGPLGAHITIRQGEERWSLALENVLGAAARSFIVFSYEDEKLLRRIHADVKRQSGERMPPLSVFVSKYRDTPYHLPPSKLPSDHLLTVAKAASIDDPNVFNILIDHVSIERIVLIDTYEDAKTQMWTTDSNRANIKEVLLPDTSKISFRAGSRNTFPPNAPRSTSLKANPSARIEYLQQRISDTDELIRSLQARQREIEHRIGELDQTNRQMARALQQEEGGLRKVDQDLKRLHEDRRYQQTQLDKAGQKVTEKSQQQEQLEHLQQQVEELDEQHQATQLEMAGVEEQIEKVRETSNFSHTHSELVERSNGLKGDLGTAEGNINVIDQKINRAQLFIAKLTDHLQKVLIPSYRAAEDALAEYQTAAEAEGGERPDDLDALPPFEELQNQIELLTNKITEEQQDSRSPTEITNEYLSAEKKYQEALQQSFQLQKFLDLTDKSLKGRVMLWMNLRRSIVKRTANIFNSSLSNRGHQGNIAFNHETEELNVEVTISRGVEAAKSKKNAASVAQSTRSLSGGERSFSTVSLLLALWDEMSVPFRAMDEFDVFMDGPNRRIAISLLQSAAFNSPNRQFIFITPHDTTVIERNANVKIHILEPPRDTTQITLGFASAQH